MMTPGTEQASSVQRILTEHLLCAPWGSRKVLDVFFFFFNMVHFMPCVFLKYKFILIVGRYGF